MKLWKLIPVILMGLLVGCQRPPSVEIYSNVEYGFSLNYPAGWGVTEEGIRDEFQVTFASPDKDADFIVIPGEYSPTYDPNEFCQWLKKFQAGIYSVEDITIDSLPAKKFLIITEDKGIWIISLDPMYPFDILYGSSQENFNNYCRDFDLMIDTLEFARR